MTHILDILAAAHVDRISAELWSVKVWGQKPHDHERLYQIGAASDNAAAQEGIRRFVEEASTNARQ